MHSFIYVHGGLVLAATVLVMTSVGCGAAEGEGFPAASEEANFGVGTGECDGRPCPARVMGPSQVCEEGSTRKCEKRLGEHDGVVSCYDGTQTCVGNAWSKCVPPPFDGPR